MHGASISSKMLMYLPPYPLICSWIPCHFYAVSLAASFIQVHHGLLTGNASVLIICEKGDIWYWQQKSLIHLSDCFCLLQKWRPKGVALQHMVSGLCLDSQIPDGPLVIAQCRPQVAGQSWEPQIINWLHSWGGDKWLHGLRGTYLLTWAKKKRIFFWLPQRNFCELLSFKSCCCLMSESKKWQDLFVYRA